MVSKAKSFHVHRLPPEVARAAKEIGLDPQEDRDYLWIADFAAHMELPSEWTTIEDDEGQPAYYHPGTKRLTKVHPVLTKYKAMLEKLKRFVARTGLASKDVEAHIAMILNEVLNRCNRELSPVTPEILERLALLLGIHTSEEHCLARTLRMCIESYAEDQYDLAVQAHEKADVSSFLREIRREQVKEDVINKPEEVIMCSEVEGEPARVKCEQCKDFFSLEGFSVTHSTGKRKAHTTRPCCQTTCSVYRDQKATCEVNGDLYCDKAYAEVASRKPELLTFRKKIIGGLPCSEYPGKAAEVLCEDCSDLFCAEAFIELHRRGNRARHVGLRLDEEGQLYRAGELLSPEETARLIDRARLARDGGPWLAFQDDQLNTYWFHLHDKVTTTRNPYL